MIVVELSGGMGNQMFQYAIGRNLSLKHNAALKFDANKLRLNWHRTYALKPLNVLSDFLTLRARNKLLKNNTYTVIKEKTGEFNNAILEFRDNLYLKGYWQSEKYFKENENIIRKDFTFNTGPDEKNKKFIEQIEASESVAIHVRKGDYETITKTNKRYGGICDLNYYQKCVDYIASSIANPLFFIFSDDPNWAKQNIKLKFPAIYISHNSTRKHFKLENNYLFRNSLILFKHLLPDRSHEDLRLMSCCKHFIVANSSFSWWGAWLGKHSHKIVCAPGRWINIEPHKIDSSNVAFNHLIPETWIKF